MPRAILTLKGLRCVASSASRASPALCDGGVHGFDGHALLGLTEHAFEGSHITCRRHKLVTARSDQDKLNTVSGIHLEVVANLDGNGGVNLEQRSFFQGAGQT